MLKLLLFRRAHIFFTLTQTAHYLPFSHMERATLLDSIILVSLWFTQAMLCRLPHDVTVLDRFSLFFYSLGAASLQGDFLHTHVLHLLTRDDQHFNLDPLSVDVLSAVQLSSRGHMWCFYMWKDHRNTVKGGKDTPFICWLTFCFCISSVTPERRSP